MTTADLGPLLMTADERTHLAVLGFAHLGASGHAEHFKACADAGHIDLKLLPSVKYPKMWEATVTCPYTLQRAAAICPTLVAAVGLAVLRLRDITVKKMEGTPEHLRSVVRWPRDALDINEDGDLEAAVTALASEAKRLRTVVADVRATLSDEVLGIHSETWDIGEDGDVLAAVKELSEKYQQANAELWQPPVGSLAYLHRVLGIHAESKDVSDGEVMAAVRRIVVANKNLTTRVTGMQTRWNEVCNVLNTDLEVAHAARQLLRERDELRERLDRIETTATSVVVEASSPVTPPKLVIGVDHGAPDGSVIVKTTWQDGRVVDVGRMATIAETQAARRARNEEDGVQAVYPFPPHQRPLSDSTPPPASDDLTAAMARIAVLEARIAALDYLLVAFPPLPAGWVWSTSAMGEAGEVFRNDAGTWDVSRDGRDPDSDPIHSRPTVYDAIAALQSQRGGR